jgi:CRP/FNR family transcriptional regulator
MTYEEFIQAFPVFRSGPAALVRDLLSASSLQTVPAGVQIYRQGDSCGAIAFVLSGDIRVYRIGETGREITLYEIGPGETCILNASCILSGKTYPAHAASLSPVEMLLVPSSTFRQMVAAQEVMRNFVFGLLSERLSGVMELVDEVAFGKLDQRLADYLIEKAENGIVEATHQRIANDLGTSREVVSRLLKDLERKGVLRLSRSSIGLTDIDKISKSNMLSGNS